LTVQFCNMFIFLFQTDQENVHIFASTFWVKKCLFWCNLFLSFSDALSIENLCWAFYFRLKMLLKNLNVRQKQQHEKRSSRSFHVNLERVQDTRKCILKISKCFLKGRVRFFRLDFRKLSPENEQKYLFYLIVSW